jgi:hypothetical protein
LCRNKCLWLFVAIHIVSVYIVRKLK